MIDFVKLYIDNPDISGIRGNPTPERIEHPNNRTGEINYMAIYNGLTFPIRANKYFYVSGRFTDEHLANQNYQDFINEIITNLVSFN